MKKKKAFTLIELLVVVAIIALLISILLPSLSRARELSKRLVCAANVKGMGTAFKIYANDNDESWPVPAFDESLSSEHVKWYSKDIAVGYGAATVGSDTMPGRLAQSLTGDEEASTSDGASTISVTRAMWILVRSGDVTAKSFICPSSGDQIDTDQNVDLYYDFKSIRAISYGYQVPFGGFSSRPSESCDPRLIVGGDRGPYYSTDTASISAMQAPKENSNWETDILKPALTQQQWMGYNSPNHAGEGQNVLFGDGHATFEKTPLAGIDEDNIYTMMSYEEGSTTEFARGAVQSGMLPKDYVEDHYYPGHNAIASGINSSTDSLIFP